MPLTLLTELRWLVVLAGLYALVATGGLAAWWLVGDAWWNQLVNVTTFWWTLPALPLLLLALGFRQWTVALLLLVPVGLLLWTYGGLFLPAGPASRGDLRVASFNIYVQARGVAHVVDLVRQEQPDVLLVQEVVAEQARLLEDALEDELPHAWFGEPDPSGGVGVVSRHPIEEVRAIPGADRFERPTAVVVIRTPSGRRVQVVPVHLVALCPPCRPFVASQRAEVESRRRQTRAVLDALDEGLPAVVGGDFNGNRRSDAYRMLARAGFRDPQTEVGSGLGLTFPAEQGRGAGSPPVAGRRAAAVPATQPTTAHLPFVSFPVLRLDQILVRGLVPADARVGASGASDHRPVVADLAWPASGPADPPVDPHATRKR